MLDPFQPFRIVVDDDDVTPGGYAALARPTRPQPQMMTWPDMRSM
jgi:hypothetical protein